MKHQAIGTLEDVRFELKSARQALARYKAEYDNDMRRLTGAVKYLERVEARMSAEPQPEPEPEPELPEAIERKRHWARVSMMELAREMTTVFATDEMQSIEHLDYIGNSRTCDNIKDHPIDWQAYDVPVGSRLKWELSKVVNDTEFHTYNGHLEARGGSGTRTSTYEPVFGNERVSVRRPMTPVYRRPVVEYPSVIGDVIQREAGDFATMAVKVGEGRTARWFAVDCSRLYLKPNAFGRRLWRAFKPAGMKMRKGAWIWEPQRVVDARSADEAEDLARWWANETELADR